MLGLAYLSKKRDVALLEGPLWIVHEVAPLHSDSIAAASTYDYVGLEAKLITYNMQGGI